MWAGGVHNEIKGDQEESMTKDVLLIHLVGE